MISKIFLVDWNADLTMDDEREEFIMNEATNELAILISSLNLVSKEMPIEEHMQLVGEEIVDAKYNPSHSMS